MLYLRKDCSRSKCHRRYMFACRGSAAASTPTGSSLPCFRATRAGLSRLSRAKWSATQRHSPVIGAPYFRWDYGSHDRLLNATSVPIATIGGVIEAAQHSSHMFDSFLGSSLGYHVFHVYVSVGQPPMFDRSIVIKTLDLAALWALENDDFTNCP